MKVIFSFIWIGCGCVVSLCVVSFAWAAPLTITEIMYDISGTDTGREWIEIQNTGSTTIDISTWKLFEANVNHKITGTSTAEIGAGEFAIIADNTDKFKTDNPGYTGLVFDSAFSLSGEGETLILRDEGGADIDTVSYIPGWGAAGDGNSLQKTVMGVWVAAPPTPGLATIATESVTPPLDTTSNTTASSTESGDDTAEITTSGPLSTHTSQEVANTSYQKPVFEITTGRPRIGFIGSPLSFEVKIKKAKDIFGAGMMRTAWSFGDGAQVIGHIVTHAYEYPGDYIVIANSDYGGEHAVSKIAVKILEPHILLELLPDSALRISNTDSGEVNIGSFIIEDASRRFIVPIDTIIRPHSSIVIPISITGIRSVDRFIRIATPLGNILNQIDIPMSTQMAEPLIILPEQFTVDRFRAQFEEFYQKK